MGYEFAAGLRVSVTSVSTGPVPLYIPKLPLVHRKFSAAEPVKAMRSTVSPGGAVPSGASVAGRKTGLPILVVFRNVKELFSPLPNLIQSRPPVAVRSIVVPTGSSVYDEVTTPARADALNSSNNTTQIGTKRIVLMVRLAPPLWILSVSAQTERLPGLGWWILRRLYLQK